MPAGGKNTVDFSAFDNAVKQTPDKGVDFSAFDDAVKKKDGGKPSPTALPSNAPLSLSERINQAVDNPQKQTGFKSTPIFGERKTNIPAKDKAAAQQAKHNQEVADAYQPKDKIIAPNGIDLPVSYDWTTSPQLHNQVVDNLQASIDMGEITPQVVGVTSKLTGKSPDATAAYLQGDATTGNAFDRVDVLKKNATELTGIIQKANAEFGWNTNPDEVLGNADLTSKWLSKYLLTLQQSDPVQQKKDEIEAQGRDLDIETLNAIISDDQNLKDRVANYVTQLKELNPLIGAVKTHIATQAAKEGYAKGESEEQTANKIALLTNPVGYKNAQEALKKPFGFDRLSDQSNLGDIVGGLADEIGGDKTFKNQMLNSVMDEARYKLNESYKKNAEDQAAIAHLSNDPDMLNEAKLMYAKYDKDILNKLPSLQLVRMANEVSNDIATAAGQLEGTETNDFRLKSDGATQQDIVAIMQEKGWFTDPNKKALAMQIATHPEMVKDASYFGGAKDSFLQPFKDLGLSLLDVTDIRSFKDRMADKFKDELFPKEFSDEETKSAFSILGHDFKTRHIVNGISNLAGLTVGNILTEGVAGEVGLSANAAKRLSAYVTFGIPSIDANLKDSYSFIDNDVHRAAYVTLGTLINGEGGALLDLGKISRVPGLKEPFMALSKNLVEKNLSTEAKDELLNVAKNKYVDFVKKWGKVGVAGAKNTAEGAATMAYFGFANQYNKLLNGDPNTKAEDLLPTAGNAFLDGVFTMIPFGFVRAVKETKNNPNSTYKEMINKLSVMPTAAEDILRMGSKSPEDFNYKMSVVNTARAAKNSLDATEQATGINLNPDQRSVYVANKTIEAVLRDKAAKINDKGKREQLEAQADELAEQSTKTLDGLKFTPTLEPLYDLYDAEKRYNKALDDFNNSGGTDDRRLVEAKKNYERLQYKYFNDTKPAEEVKQPEEKTFTDFDKTLFHEGKLTPLGEDIKARIAKGENITVLTSRENTPANVDFISQTLGIPTENIKAGLDAKGKANELTAYSGKKVFYDDNPDNVAEAQKTDARVVNTGLTPEQQIVQDNADDIKNPIYRDVVKAATKGEDIDGVLKEVSDQWHDLRSRNQAEDGFPKPIIEAAKKLYPQEENAGLEIKSDPEQPKVTEGSGLNEDANKILGLHDNGANFDLFDNNKLREIAKENGIDLPEGAKNSDIIEALKNKRNEATAKGLENLSEKDFDKLTPSQKVALYKEHGITKDDGSPITEKDIESNPLQYSYDFMASSDSGKWNSANSELESAVQGNRKQYSLYKLMNGEFDTFKEFVDFINSKNYGDKIEYTERMKRADDMSPAERKSAVDSYNKSVEDKAGDKSQKEKDILDEHGLKDETEYSPHELVEKFPLKGVQKVIWDIISPIVKKLGIKVKFSSSRITEGFDGSSNPMNGEVLLRPSTLKNGRLGEVLVHEVVHSLTTKIISRVNSGVETGLTSKQVAAVKGLGKLYKSIEADNNLQNKYPVKDIFEFIAHLTNDTFVKELQSKDRNFIQKVVDFISDILGLSDANELAKKYLKDIIHDGTFLEKEGITVVSSDYAANVKGAEGLTPKQRLLEAIKNNSKTTAEKYHDLKSKGKENDFTKAEVAAQKLEAERDAKISDIQKPEPKLEFLTSKDIVDSEDPLGNKATHEKIKDNFKELKKLIECLWS